MKPLFEEAAGPILQECANVFQERGEQYGDTWRNCQWIKVKSAGKLLGLNLTSVQCAILAASAMCDLKHQREEGGYKRDSPVDGINYEALRVGLIDKHSNKQASQ